MTVVVFLPFGIELRASCSVSCITVERHVFLENRRERWIEPSKTIPAMVRDDHVRLEKGLFAKLWRSETAKELSLTKTELELFLQGSQLVGRLQLSPSPLVSKDLRSRPRARATSNTAIFVARRAGRAR